MVIYHFVFLGLIIGSYLFFLYLDLINLRYGREMVRKEEDWLDEKFGIEDPERLLNYQLLKTGFSQLKTAVGTAGLILVLYTDLPNLFVDSLSVWTGNVTLQGILFFVALTVFGVIFSLPFSAFETFVVEEIFDFNQQTLSLWIRDKIKGLFIGLIFTVILSGAVLWFIELLPQFWWLAGWLLFVLFGLLMQIIYPRIIAPLFNDFEPIEGDELEEAIQELFDRAGFTCSDIYRMDASKRSSHSNAYFVGFGRTKRVVLFDTLIEQMAPNEVQGVLAHELAHWKKGHIWESVARGAVRTLILFLALYWIINTNWLYTMFGLPQLPYLGIFLGVIWISPISQLISPLENWRSLINEREADEYAVKTLGDGDGLINALYGLAGENLSNPFPHPLYASFHYTHPPIPDRIRHIKEYSEDS